MPAPAFVLGNFQNPVGLYPASLFRAQLSPYDRRFAGKFSHFKSFYAPH
ncbi:MAG: hypothetical protein LBB09_02840 [Rickettsiales bacterium]|jgi:hypothetical protein|nr:hypothetical protein [Rickettsiales bacterium]